MGTSKILIDGVGIDLTQDTVAANKMLSGIKAHDSNGDGVTGNIQTWQGTQKSGVKNITANGTYDVSEYASAAVNVPVGSMNSKTYNIVLSSDIPIGGLATVVSGDEDIASHALDANILIAFRAEALSTGENSLQCGVMGYKTMSGGYHGYGLRNSTSAGGTTFFEPNDLATNHQGIKLDTSGNMKFMSGATYKFLAGTYTVVISW